MMNSRKFALIVATGLFLLLFFVAGAFMLLSLPDAYKSEALILVEQRRTRDPEPATENLSLIVKKSERKMYLYKGKSLNKTYKIALGFNPIGTKTKQGDGATPEGEYFLTHKNAQSKFYLSLGVSFPNISDAESGLQRKLITVAEKDQIVAANNNKQKPPQNTKLGGDIFLHGGGTSSDWTWGCIALSNEDIKELFDLLPLKTRIRIEP
jgi:murein L,D-transpeptidase YafK